MWHALLAGIPEDELFQMILDGRSMFVMDKARRVFCSSIVGGILPIALGHAQAIKWNGGGERAWTLIGDMTERTGLYYEFVTYCNGHNLPVMVVIEDNGLSTNTPTSEVWGTPNLDPLIQIQLYRYDRTHPHVGLSERVNF